MSAAVDLLIACGGDGTVTACAESVAGTGVPLAVAPVARFLGIDHIVCNRLVADERGMLTGEVEQPVVWGPTKASGVREFAAEHGVDLGASYFYADGDEDLSLMRLVGRPRPVNPGPGLTKVAIGSGWPIMRFRSRGERWPGWDGPSACQR